MATAQKTIDYLTDQMSRVGDIRSRKMFGEYAIYCHDKVVALVCDDQLYVKPTEAGRKYLVHPNEAPPYPGAKLYYLIDAARWDDHEWLGGLITVTQESLPMPKPKTLKRKGRAK